MRIQTLLTCILAVCLVGPVAFAQDSSPSGKPSRKEDLCVKPARGPIDSASEPHSAASVIDSRLPSVARVGKPAPDFEANAFSAGSFRPVKLSDYQGKWVVLCFYPGDFTFI